MGFISATSCTGSLRKGYATSRAGDVAEKEGKGYATSRAGDVAGKGKKEGKGYATSSAGDVAGKERPVLETLLRKRIESRV